MASPLRKPAGAQVAPLRCPILHCWQFYSIMAFRCSLLSQIRLSLTWGALHFMKPSLHNGAVIILPLEAVCKKDLTK